ncbi:MAG: hypothetical protein ACKO2Z_11365, partial [Sphaerospermopsis kisseleviana]
LIVELLTKKACEEVDKDAMVWDHKIFLENPPLYKEEHSINQFREWVRHFYTESEEPEQQATISRASATANKN